jgi:hypothetical protein
MDLDFTSETITPDSTTLLTIGGTGALQLPSGTTAQEPSGASAGALRWNSSVPQLEYHNGTIWIALATNTGTVTSITGTAGVIASASVGAVTLSTPITSTGDLILGNGTNSATRLAIGSNGSVLTSNGTTASWSGSTTGASYSTTVTPSTLVSGNYYSAVITHNLGTNNISVTVYDNSTLKLVNVQSIQQTSTNAFTMTVVGNTRTYLVIVIANGAWINGNVGSTIKSLSYFATSLDSPNNADWTVNTLAPTISDPANNAISVRQFSNTANSGVGLTVPIPANASNISFNYQGRSQTAATGTLQFQLYTRTIVNVTTPAAPSAWSSANLFTSQSIASNVFYYSYTYTVSLATLSLTAGNTYQFELVRNTGVAGNLAQPWLLQGLTVSFT